ncbi:MAG: ABC transporter substrate-binding protein [Pirellulaceae bacterium]|nr:ABC transporter substrate-binding protein [Pirellulaceae bacterium]
MVRQTDVRSTAIRTTLPAHRSDTMSKQSLVVSLILCLSITSSCSRSSRESDSGSAATERVSVQLNWKAESEHGGLYQAEADGIFRDAGLSVQIRPGGINAPIGPELELARCQFAMANADDVVLLRNEGVDIVAVLAAMQNHPRCIVVRADSGIETFDDLAGKTFQHGPRPFVEFMRRKGLLKNVKEVPYQGSVAPLVADPDVTMQGYSFSEPLLAGQQGVKVRTLMVSDLGFNPYSSVLVTTGTMIRDQPDLVRRFVQATRKGWQNYLTDPTNGNQAILEANDQMTSEALKLGMDELRKLAMPSGTPLESVGQMSDDRWQTLVQQLRDLELIDANVQPNDCFTLDFL